MMKRISLLLPTRGRPNLVARLLRSIVAESAHPESIEVVVCVDDDDVESHGISSDELKLKLVIVPRQSMGMYNSICLAESSGDITIAINDDMVVRTKGWDDRVRSMDARYGDGIYLGYGNDLFKGAKLCSFPILSRETCQALGDPYPPVYRGAFLDTQLMDIFNRLKHRGHDRFAYDKDLVFEHVHYRAHPEAFDATYAERLRFGDDPSFIALVEARRLGADRLMAAISDHAPLAGSGHAPVAVPQASPIPLEPAGPIGIVFLCLRKFLFDPDLPLRWRCYLFAWMIARFYYSRLRRIP
jgi:glycosyltransferase involved in cell wall biosynthesis